MLFVELPYGWEEVKDLQRGTSIYIDHNTGKGLFIYIIFEIYISKALQ